MDLITFIYNIFYTFCSSDSHLLIESLRLFAPMSGSSRHESDLKGHPRQTQRTKIKPVDGYSLQFFLRIYMIRCIRSEIWWRTFCRTNWKSRRKGLELQIWNRIRDGNHGSVGPCCQDNFPYLQNRISLHVHAMSISHKTGCLCILSAMIHYTWSIHQYMCHDRWYPGGCFTNVSGAIQNNLAKIYNARNHIYGENVKLKLSMCAQSMAMGTRTKFQLEIIIRTTISAIHKFQENILESSRNVSETASWLLTSPGHRQAWYWQCSIWKLCLPSG